MSAKGSGRARAVRMVDRFNTTVSMILLLGMIMLAMYADDLWWLDH